MTRPTGTVTFLFTDIENSTLLWEQHPAWMQSAFARQEAIIRAAVGAHNGYLYKMVGDAFQVAFATAPAALAAAMQAQAALHAEDWGQAGPLRVRMALHTGVTDERGDDYVGPALNRVARLLSAAQGGQVLLTQATYELVRDPTEGVPHDTVLHDLGEHRLKDLIRPEHIYQAAPAGHAPDLGGLRALDAFAHNLPMQVTSFIGREKEIVEVKRLLLAERLITLTGPGGTGKTRLSLQVGADLLELFPDGVWLVELVSLADPALVVQTVAVTLGVRESSGRPLLSQLTGYLRGKDVLLILDNCEHLVDACAQLVTTLLQACPTLFVLASSRESLGIAGETAYRVPSLSTPDTRRPTPHESLTQYEAVRLFIERAETVQPGFAVTRENAPAIAQICHRLEGIPLAIELAAVRIRMLSVEQIAARLDDRFRLLTGGSRTAMPRHQTLRALIDWSYDLLTGTERILLRRLAVFAGGWTLDAAEAICAGDGLETDAILDALSQLINKSLVQPDCEPAPEARYRLLETIRQYARERLLEAGGGEGVRQRHLDYFLALAEAAEPDLRGARQVVALDRLEKEIDNLRGALEWSLEANVVAGMRLAGALLWYWHIRSRKTEGMEWLERLLEEDARVPLPDADSLPHQSARGKALNTAGALLVMHGDAEKGYRLSEESLALHRSLGLAGRRGAGIALWNLAEGRARHEDLDQAIALSEESLALMRAVQDKFWIAQCLDNLGSYALIRGDFNRSKAIWEEDLALRHALGDQDGIAWVLSCLASLYFWHGDHEQAKRLFDESIGVFRKVNNLWGVSMALSGLGTVVLAQGELAEASSLYEEALSFGREMGDQNTVAGRRYDLARVAWSQGDYARAGKLYEDTLAFLREIDNQGGIAGTLYDLGGVAWAMGDLDLAARRYEEALGLARRMNAGQTIGAALQGLARVAGARGDLPRAHTLLAEALTVMRRVANPWGLGFAIEAFALLAVAERDLVRGATLLGATESTFKHLRFLLSPLEREERLRTIAAARAALGAADFDTHFAAGQALSLDQAIEYALAEPA